MMAKIKRYSVIVLFLSCLGGFLLWDFYEGGFCRSVAASWMSKCADKYYHPWAEQGIGFSAPNYLDVITFETSVVGSHSLPFTDEQLTNIFLDTFQKSFEKKFSSEGVLLTARTGNYVYETNPYLSRMILILEENKDGSGWQLKFTIKRSALAIERVAFNPKTVRSHLTSTEGNFAEFLKSCAGHNDRKDVLEEVYAYRAVSFFYTNGEKSKEEYLDKPYQANLALKDDRYVGEPMSLEGRLRNNLFKGTAIPNLESEIDLLTWVKEWIDEYAYEYIQKARPENELTRELTKALRESCKRKEYPSPPEGLR